ncbi:MAG: hypothetical protein GF364_18750 [Candidatus Lokiarchaeota archaeon]|nr:hypothetical protein [Candidatus Lokiarchaeota archaeon]
MSEEPQLPPIPAIGDVLDRKDDMKEFKYTLYECLECGERNTRDFIEGDFVFKIFDGKKCENCNSNKYIIKKIYAEFKKSKKGKKKK